MTGATEKLRVLIVEDSMMVLFELDRVIRALGYEIVGPAGTVKAALDLIDSCERIDAALLDVNLNGELVFPVAERLDARGFRYALMTGYLRESLPQKYASTLLLAKPFGQCDVKDMLEVLTGVTTKGSHSTAANA